MAQPAPLPSRPPRWRRPGRGVPTVAALCVAGTMAAVGVTGYFAADDFASAAGAAILFGVPVSVGVVLGLYISPRAWLLLIGILILVVGVMVSFEAAGVVDAVAVAFLAAFLSAPIVLGSGIGALVAWLLRRRRARIPRDVQEVFALLACLWPLLSSLQ